MSDVKSKNLYELLGNDHDQDSDKEPEPPTKAIDKTQSRVGKRDAPKEKVDQPARTRDPERRRGGFTGSERAFRDRPSGRNPNRETTENEDGTVRGRDSGPGTQRAGRGPRGPRRGGDRHVNRSGKTEHAKQADQSWGAPTGEGEWNDEKAGEAMAQQEVKEDGFDANAAPPVDGEGNVLGEGEEAEAPDTSKSYADYLAEQASKKLESLGLKEARAPNEGSKDNKKWKEAKELTKDNEGESYFIGEAKAKRERERASKKNVLDIDYAFKEQPRDTRGGRGGPRGRGRGEFRGSRGGRGDRADRGDRTDRGGRGDRGDRGAFRGRGRGDAPNVAVNDEAAFPTLGGK